MRFSVYLWTFLAWGLVYCLRAGYGFSKPYFQREFQISNMFLAIIDAFQYSGLAVGFATKYFLYDTRFTI